MPHHVSRGRQWNVLPNLPNTMFGAYHEFMVDYLELQGGGCFGGRETQSTFLLPIPYPHPDGPLRRMPFG